VGLDVVRREEVCSAEALGGLGIDWDVTTTATTTDPAYDLPRLGHRKRCAGELAKAQRKMIRRRVPGKAASSLPARTKTGSQTRIGETASESQPAEQLTRAASGRRLLLTATS